MAQPKGKQLSASYDTSTNLRSTPGYDALNRMTSVLYRNQDCTYNSLMQWTYDRYGNRWTQTVSGGAGAASQPSVQFDLTSNHMAGAVYDAAGNMLQDPSGNTYTYDAEGNLVASSLGSTQSTYNALNQRVAYQAGGQTTFYVFNPNGQRSAIYDASENLLQNQIYWAGTPVAFIKGGTLQYQFQNWIGTETFTVAPGTALTEYAANPFGDGFTATSGSDTDPFHFAGLDGDADGTMHAQFRNYQPTFARWLSPDPYDGSYTSWNPQSSNRYNYARNNPFVMIDPSGLDSYQVADNCVYYGTSYSYYDPASNTMQVGDDWSLIGCLNTSSGTAASAGASSSSGSGGASASATNNAVPSDPCAYMGRALPPSAYAAAGKAAEWNPVKAFLDLAKGFPIGGYFDAQPLGNGSVVQRAAYGNYAYGAYMAASGVPLFFALGGAEAAAAKNKLRNPNQYANRQMSRLYPLLPSDNVANITNGFNAQRSGTLCHP